MAEAAEGGSEGRREGANMRGTWFLKFIMVYSLCSCPA